MTSFTCPVDGATLVPLERQGIEIDHCPSCRGVWLDRGELDKIIERSAAPAARESYREPERHHAEHHHDDRRGGYPPRRKRSFLEDLFD
ncbi:MAG: zf-TFIIB domain-containing protein [Pseudomonadota bacterium]